MVVLSFTLSPIVILSESMFPAIKTGDVVIVNRDVDYDGIVAGEEGHVVVIDGPSIFLENGVPSFVYAHLDPGVPIVHRVIEKRHINDTYYFITKGDNNPYPDGCFKYKIHENETYALYEYNYTDPVLIPQDRIIGQVVSVIPFIGYFKIHATTILFHSIVLIASITFVKICKRKEINAAREKNAIHLPT